MRFRFDEAMLEPIGAHAVLARMLANLRNVFVSRGDRISLLWVLRLRTLLPDATGEERADLAANLAALGRFDAAACEYDLAAEGLGGTLGGELRRSAARLRARLNSARGPVAARARGAGHERSWCSKATTAAATMATATPARTARPPRESPWSSWLSPTAQ